MRWWFAYEDAILPYMWLYGLALVVVGGVFLAIPKLRRNFLMVVLLLVARQVLDTNAYLFSKETAPASWVVIGHFIFFLAVVHYIIVAVRGVIDHFHPAPRKRSTLLISILYGSVMVTAAMVYLEVTEGNINFGIGIASVAAVIGFALQETLANLFAGLTLEADPPFRVGDWIHGEGFTGEVIDITWRATRLRTYENDTLIIPNRNLANAQIVNWSSYSRNHGVHLTIGASYSDAPGRVKQALLTALNDCEGVLKQPAPEIYTKDYGDFAITHDVLFFITDYKNQNRIKDRFLSRVWYQFRRDGIKIPFPIRDINLQMNSKRDRVADLQQEMDRKVGLLTKLPLFSSLPADEIKFLAGEAHFQVYWNGENVIRQGDIPNFLSVVVDGTAKVLLHTGDLNARDRDLVVKHHDEEGKVHQEVQHPASPEASASASSMPAVEVDVQGGYAEVSQLKAGDFFGEISVLLGKEASATVQSAGELLLLVIDRDAFVKVLDKHPEFQESICTIISKRVQYLHHITKMTQDKKDEVAEEPHTLIRHLRRFLRLTEIASAR